MSYAKQVKNNTQQAELLALFDKNFDATKSFAENFDNMLYTLTGVFINKIKPVSLETRYYFDSLPALDKFYVARTMHDFTDLDSYIKTIYQLVYGADAT